MEVTIREDIGSSGLERLEARKFLAFVFDRIVIRLRRCWICTSEAMSERTIRTREERKGSVCYASH